MIIEQAMSQKRGSAPISVVSKLDAGLSHPAQT
jgi:hypothetical protein